MNVVTETGPTTHVNPIGSIPEVTQESGDLGYSLATGSNAFSNLKQLLQDENQLHATYSAHNSPRPASASDPRLRALIAQLPSMPAIEELVAAYFADVHWHYFILEKYYFDHLFSCWYGVDTGSVEHLDPEQLAKELHYFPALLYQVLALALQVLSPGSIAWKLLSPNDVSLCASYSDIGMEVMAILGRPGLALTAVQADFLRTSWLKNNGKGVEAWHSIGNAIRYVVLTVCPYLRFTINIRSAQELALHRQMDIPPQGTSRIEKTLSLIWYEEYKRRLWMNLCNWDW